MVDEGASRSRPYSSRGLFLTFACLFGVGSAIALAAASPPQEESIVAAQGDQNSDTEILKREASDLPVLIDEEEFGRLAEECADNKCLEELVSRQTEIIEVRFNFIEENQEKFDAISEGSKSYVEAELNWQRCVQNSLGLDVVGDATSPEELRNMLSEQAVLPLKRSTAIEVDIEEEITKIDRELAERLQAIDICVDTSGLAKERDLIITEVMG
jgi:hypothetical protein